MSENESASSVTVDEGVLFDPFPKQIEFVKAVLLGLYSLILYGGAIRGGKTYCGLGTLILLCKIYPGSRWAIVRKDLPTLKRTTIPSFKKICPTNFLKGGSFSKGYNKTEQIVTFENGSQIIFFPENYKEDKDLNRWKGLEVNGFLLEEVNELQEESLYKAIERAGSHIIPGTKKQPKPIVMATCNPTQNHIKKLLYTPWKEGRLRPEWLYIPSKITDNPYISEEYKKALKSLPRYQYEVYVLGNWDIKLKTGIEFYKLFSLDNNVKPVKYDRSLPLHISFDENFNPYLPVTIWQAKGKKAWQIDEITAKPPNNSLKDLCGEISRRYKFHTTGMFIYGDATSKKQDTKIEKGQNFFKLAAGYLTKFQPILRVPPSNPPVVMRGAFINALFEGRITGSEVVIGEECHKTIDDFTNVYEAADGTKLKITVKDPKTGVTYQPFGHLSDSSDYFLCRYFDSEFKEFQGLTTMVTEARNAGIGKRVIKRSF